MGKGYQAEIFCTASLQILERTAGYKYENNSLIFYWLLFSLRLSEQMMDLEIFSILFKKL